MPTRATRGSRSLTTTVATAMAMRTRATADTTEVRTRSPMEVEEATGIRSKGRTIATTTEMTNRDTRRRTMMVPHQDVVVATSASTPPDLPRTRTCAHPIKTTAAVVVMAKGTTEMVVATSREEATILAEEEEVATTTIVVAAASTEEATTMTEAEATSSRAVAVLGTTLATGLRSPWWQILCPSRRLKNVTLKLSQISSG